MTGSLSPMGHGKADGSADEEEESEDEEEADAVSPHGALSSPGVPAHVEKDEPALMFPGSLRSEKMAGPLKESPDGRTLSSSEEEDDESEHPPRYAHEEQEDSRGAIIPDEPLVIPDKSPVIPDEPPISHLTGAGGPPAHSAATADPSSPGGRSSEDDDEDDSRPGAQFSPDEAKKRGLSFDYTEPQVQDGQGFLAGRENGSEKTPEESRSPDSCRADPGSPFSPSTAPEREASPSAEDQAQGEEEDEDEEDSEEEVVTEIVPKVETFGEAKKPEEPAYTMQMTPEKLLESRDEDLMASVSPALVMKAAPVTVAAPVARPDTSPKDAKAPPQPPADTAKKAQKAPPTAAAPPPRAGDKFPRAPPAGAPASRKPNVPAAQNKGLSSVLFISPLSVPLSLSLSQMYIPPPHSPAPP